mmetsp:Transcript_48841/g.151217  ORF Transcript_48841/g.151217 Transcript_48841/m.151217 type:complete len:232 (-) Transcript_48841:141-836(-)
MAEQRTQEHMPVGNVERVVVDHVSRPATPLVEEVELELRIVLARLHLDPEDHAPNEISLLAHQGKPQGVEHDDKTRNDQEEYEKCHDCKHLCIVHCLSRGLCGIDIPADKYWIVRQDQAVGLRRHPYCMRVHWDVRGRKPADVKHNKTTVFRLVPHVAAFEEATISAAVRANRPKAHRVFCGIADDGCYAPKLAGPVTHPPRRVDVCVLTKLQESRILQSAGVCRWQDVLI